MSNVDTYIHKITTNRPGKWRSIALANLAASMTVAELEEAFTRAQAILIEEGEKHLARLKELDAPPVIMKHCEGQFDKIKSGKLPDLAILTRQLKKLRA